MWGVVKALRQRGGTQGGRAQRRVARKEVHTRQLELRVVWTVVVCQFLSAFCALGMAPFFSIIVQKYSKSSRLDAAVLTVFSGGLLFHFPTFCGALVSPLWGKLADRLGRKTLLLRAQLGLALSFILAGYSSHVWQFVLALWFQGLLGGTYAASRAYLASQLAPEKLSASLTWMEAAPRLAWLIAPILIGCVLPEEQPSTLYRSLLFLPLLAFGMTVVLPKNSRPSLLSRTTPSLSDSYSRGAPESAFWVLLAVQFILGLASGMVSPYFIEYLTELQEQVQGVGLAKLGFIFGIPHLVYLLLAVPLGRVSNRVFETVSPRTAIQWAFFWQAFCLLGQGVSKSLIGVMLWRIAMGVSLTVCLVAIHEWIARSPQLSAARFGWLDGASRMSALLGGVLAGIGTLRFALVFPFYGGAFFLVLGAMGLWVQKRISQLSPEKLGESHVQGFAH